MADEIAKEVRKRHEIDVDGEKHQLNRHQNDDDILAVEKDAKHAQRKQRRSDGQVMLDADGHLASLSQLCPSGAGMTDPPDGTLTTSTPSFRERATCAAID